MKIKQFEDSSLLGAAAAADGADAIIKAIARNGYANIILATGASQFTMLDALANAAIDWHKVRMFHLDEYIGISVGHPASFRRYLHERFTSRVPELGTFVAIDGDCDDLGAELARLNATIAGQTIDVCFAGIGENGHLAFNDPPADFVVQEPFIVVELDLACRQQQVSEGWFEDVSEVPMRAVSMSVTQIMKSQMLILSVPGKRKTEAVSRSVNGPVSPDCPASIIQTHPQATLYLDAASASGLGRASV